MFPIRDNRDLRMAYEHLLFLATLKNFKEKKEYVDELKRNIRKFTHKKNETRLIKDYGMDGYVILKPCPDWVETKEDAEEWFEGNEKLTYQWSPYDCTGQLFTSYHYLFVRNGKWMCYHSISCDV